MATPKRFRLKFKRLDNGCQRADFIDLNGDACSLQESSAALPADCVWVGQNEGNHHHVTGECTSRAFLNREMARELGLWLLHFAARGRLIGQPVRARVAKMAGRDPFEKTADRLRKKLDKLAEAAEEVSLMIPDDAHESVGCRFVGRRLRVTCWACLAQDKLGTIHRMGGYE